MHSIARITITARLRSTMSLQHEIHNMLIVATIQVTPRSMIHLYSMRTVTAAIAPNTTLELGVYPLNGRQDDDYKYSFDHCIR